MSGEKGISGPQFRADRSPVAPREDNRPVEHEAVRTTIVGGRPPGSGQAVGSIPRGIEVLIKKASIDPEFKTLFLDRRAAAAESIGLVLEPAEAMILAATPREQLETIIARTSVPQEHRRAFLGQAAAAMLATIAVQVAGCKDPAPEPTQGIRPDDSRLRTGGIAPDRPPERPEPTKK